MIAAFVIALLVIPTPESICSEQPMRFMGAPQDSTLKDALTKAAAKSFDTVNGKPVQMRPYSFGKEMKVFISFNTDGNPTYVSVANSSGDRDVDKAGVLWARGVKASIASCKDTGLRNGLLPITLKID